MHRRMKGWLCLVAFTLLLVLITFYLKDSGAVRHQSQTVRDETTSDESAERFRSLIIPVRNEMTEFRYKVYMPQKFGNKATVVSKGCRETAQVPGKIEWITSFIDFFRNKKYRQGIGGLAKDNDGNNALIYARQMEVIDVLQSNLLNHVIEIVHMLVWNIETAEYLKSLPLKNSHKLVLRVVGRDVGLKEQFEYASECLQNRIIAISNQDNKLGKGWDNEEYHRILNEGDIMYALTRHAPENSTCTWNNWQGTTCDDGMSYYGSHDTFVLRAKTWHADLFTEIGRVTPNMVGMETLLIWVFKNKLNYRILNPCKILFVHHHHCVAIRSVYRPRVDIGKSTLVGFTDKFI